MKERITVNDILKERNQNSLSQLEEVIKNHMPYVVINMSTTGVDLGIDMPIRVCINEYVYDDTLKQYKEGIVFDNLVKCSDKALSHALDNQEYDVFKNGNIDVNSYINGENVLGQDDFQQILKRFYSALNSDATIIVNNLEFSVLMLKTINCESYLIDKINAQKVLDQVSLTKEYFESKNITPSKCTLKNLTKYLNNNNNTSLIYEGVDNKNRIINSFITNFGREQNILESEWDAKSRIEQEDKIKAMSEQGKQTYKQKSMEEKLKYLEERRIIKSENILDRQGTSDINTLYDIIEQKGTAKGYTILHFASTGKDCGNEPIQLSIFTYDIINKQHKLIFNIKDSFKIPIPIDNHELEVVENFYQKNSEPKFDAFKDADIDYQEYKALLLSNSLKTKEEIVKLISTYFENSPIKKYPLILGGKSFDLNMLEKIGYDTSGLIIDSLDFPQIIKEYCYLSLYGEEFKNLDNALGIDKQNYEASFSLKDILKANLNTHSSEDAEKNLQGTNRKCAFMGQLLESLSQQDFQVHSERFRDNTYYYERQKRRKKQETRRFESQRRQNGYFPENYDSDVELYNERKQMYQDLGNDIFRTPKRPFFENENNTSFSNDEIEFIKNGDDDFKDINSSDVKALANAIVTMSKANVELMNKYSSMNDKLIAIMEQQQKVISKILEQISNQHNDEKKI